MSDDASGSARAAAIAEVERYATQADDWDQDVRRCSEELERLQRTAASTALADPDSVTVTTARMAEMRDRVTIGRQAADEARRLAEQARRQVLRAEADDLQPDIDAARDRVREHQRRTEELLDALEEHTRAAWWPGPRAVDPAHRGLFAPGAAADDRLGVPCLQSVQERLRGDVARLERAQALLRAVADGGDVRALTAGMTYDDLPASLRAGGVQDLGWASPEQEAARYRRGLVADLNQLRSSLADLDREHGWYQAAVRRAHEDAARSGSAAEVEPVAIAAWARFFEPDEIAQNAVEHDRLPRRHQQLQAAISEAQTRLEAWDAEHPDLAAASR